MVPCPAIPRDIPLEPKSLIRTIFNLQNFYQGQEVEEKNNNDQESIFYILQYPTMKHVKKEKGKPIR